MFAIPHRGGLSAVSINGQRTASYGARARGVEVNDSVHELKQKFGFSGVVLHTDGVELCT
jgi:hypothetical protein